MGLAVEDHRYFMHDPVRNMMFKAKIPHFFKVIIDDTIREGKLGIPRKFVRRYGNNLSGTVFLKVPSGRKWQVELIKSGDDIWFGKGWQQFVDYYSLSHGSFLVFTFENLKGCCFNVIIFDKSASEIDYPIHVDDGDNEEPNNIEEEFHQLNTPEIIQIDVLAPQKLEEKSISPFSRPCKKIKLENGTGLPQVKRGKRDRVLKRTQTLTPEEKANALKRANCYYKSNNLSFSVVMQPSHVGGHFKVDAPASFAKKYMKHQLGNIILNSVDNKTWLVEYVCTKTRRFKVVRLCGGWKKFVEDNHLQVGDVCVFELINQNATKFKVVICRQNQHADQRSPRIFGNKQHLNHKEITCSKAINDIRDLNKFTTLNPYFKATLLPSYFEHNLLYVPRIFVAKCKKRSIEKFILQVENKVWPVKLINSSSRFRISAGFSAFVNDNSLQVGDVCVFELINGDTLLLNVTIYRKL